MQLKVEQLENRDCPALFSNIAENWPEDHLNNVFQDNMEGIEVNIIGAQLTNGKSVDVYAVHRDGGPRIIVRENGINIADFFAYESEFTGGIEGICAVGNKVFASPGKGGGPVLFEIDLESRTTRNFFVDFPESWRGGLTITNGPSDELLVLPAGEGAGRHLLVLDSDSGQTLLSLAFGPPDDRGAWRFVGASIGILNEAGIPVVLLEPANTVYDPVTWTAPFTVRLELRPNGTWTETYWDTSKHYGSVV